MSDPVRTETPTIKCEACQGRGWVIVEWPPWTGRPAKEECDLCNGTGREPSAVHPREGEKKK